MGCPAAHARAVMQLTLNDLIALDNPHVEMKGEYR